MRTFLSTPIVGCALLLALGACTGGGQPLSDAAASDGATNAGHRVNSQSLQIPTSSWKPGDAGARALVTGRLAREGQCLYVGEKNDAVVIVWPQGYRAQEAASGTEVIAPDGTVVATEGQELSASGGPGELPAAVDAECNKQEVKAFYIQEDLTLRR